MTLQREVTEPHPFLIAQGPFVDVLRRLRMLDRKGYPRLRLIVAIAWVPLMLGAVARYAFGNALPPIAFDISVHVRLLVAIPMLLGADYLLQERCRLAVYELHEGELLEAREVDRIIALAERLRDSRTIELLLVVGAITGGQMVLWNISGPTGVFHGIAHAGDLSFPRLWYCCVGLPLMLFVMVRWVWHWLIWSYVVIRTSRYELATIATHPDHAAGLAFIGTPVTAFSGFAFATSAVLAGAWGTQILDGRGTLQTFVPTFVGYMLIILIVACAPQLMFIGTLYRTRTTDRVRYSGFARGYVRDFDRKWLQLRTPDPLGSEDIQALNDLVGAWSPIEKMRLTPASMRDVLSIWIGAIAPLLPLVVTSMPLGDLAKHMGHAMLGGLPL